MLDIVAQGAYIMVCTLLLFLLCWTYKIINKIKTTRWPMPRKRAWWTMMLWAMGCGNFFTCVMSLCWCCTPFFCTWWTLLVMHPHVLCYSLVLFTLRLIFIWGLESLPHIVHPHELDWCASLCSHLMCNSYLLFLECNSHTCVPLSPNSNCSWRNSICLC